MNYFPFDPDPYKSAIALDDKRLSRVFSEAVMISSTYQFQVYGRKGPYATNLPVPPKLMGWLKADTTNFLWFTAWMKAMLIAMGERFGVHSQGYVSVKNYHKLMFKWLDGTPVKHPRNFINLAKSAVKFLDYTSEPDTHIAYQNYMAYQWLNVDKRSCVWTKHGIPDWFEGELI